jgi:NodT family efflux transporter outer membrane factor (OMF) lipoprotein
MTWADPSSTCRSRWQRSLLAAGASLMLASCAVGPDYVTPTIDVPPAFKEDGPWRTAAPQQIDADRPWWTPYGDPVLNGLVAQANQANQSLQIAAAQYRQAKALGDAARAAFFPTVSASVGGGRARTVNNGIKTGNSLNAGLDAGWEPDLWGGVRRQVESADAATQESAADLAAARLSIQATLVQDYLQLRVLDLQADSYTRTVEDERKSLQLAQSQYRAGVALRSDVALAESQLQTSDAARIDLQEQRAQLEHAIAVLLGKAPASFTLAPSSAWQASVPPLPLALPSDLLERRPDIAGAERHAAAANAGIGVARAAYFPSLMLSAGGGFDASRFADWFNAPARVWSLGATLAQTIFDGGARRAKSAQAVAAYDAAVASYRQTVLGGFQEVEDNLATLRVLEQEAAVQQKAVEASELSERLALAQYRGGTGPYLAVITAQTLLFAAQRASLQLQGRRLVASAALIKASGGGWTADELTRPTALARANTEKATDRHE